MDHCPDPTRFFLSSYQEKSTGTKPPLRWECHDYSPVPDGTDPLPSEAMGPSASGSLVAQVSDNPLAELGPDCLKEAIEDDVS